MSTPDRSRGEPEEVRDDAGMPSGRQTEDDEKVPPEHASTAPTHPVPAPGEPAGDMWPGVSAVRADADENDDVEGVEGVALAPPGKPDGEADTRR